MIGYHRNTLCKLLDQIKFAKNNPFDNGKIWLSVQLTIVKKVIQLETKIRDYNSEIKSLQILRKNPLNKLDKEQSQTVKKQIKKIEQKIENTRFVIDAYRSIGDAIAFTFINKLDIKPQNFKQSAGFISKKTGLEKEIDALKTVYKKGGIGILNDITSVLKYCDITLVHKDGFLPIEIKSSEFINTRIKRQKENANKIFEYLNTDKIEGLYGFQGITQRVELTSPEINYISEINSLIGKLKEQNNTISEVEKGIYYFVSKKYEKEFMDENLKGMTNPLMISLNQYKFSGQGYYPFSLSILNSNEYLDFLCGKYVLFIIIDFDFFEKHCSNLGYNLTFTDDAQFGFAIESKTKKDPFSMIKMSNHYIFRAATEFVSLKWLIEDSINQFKLMK